MFLSRALNLQKFHIVVVFVSECPCVLYLHMNVSYVYVVNELAINCLRAYISQNIYLLALCWCYSFKITGGTHGWVKISEYQCIIIVFNVIYTHHPVSISMYIYILSNYTTHMCCVFKCKSASAHVHKIHRAKIIKYILRVRMNAYICVHMCIEIDGR